MIERSVIAWDGSAAARRASTWAAERAAATSEVLSIVQVVDRTPTAEHDEAVERAISTTEDEAGRLRREHPGLSVRADVLIGDRFAELRELSAQDSLLILGTDEHGAPTRTSGWSLGTRLAAASPGPVAVVPELSESERHGVVVGVDGTVNGGLALDLAAREAIARQEPLHLVHAWQLPTGGYSLTPSYIAWLRGAHADILVQTAAQLARDFPELSLQQHLTEDSPAAALHAFAASATAVVVGTRGYGPIRRFLLGSTSHTLLLYIDAPTIVVPGESSVAAALVNAASDLL